MIVVAERKERQIMKLTVDKLVSEAVRFSEWFSTLNHNALIGVTDGKAVGTYVEHEFQKYLSKKYEMSVGSSALGIDLPSVSTDIKTTSIVQPQSSCPFKSARQKIFGLGYNLLVFVYHKKDSPNRCDLTITHCTFIDANRTADYTLTKMIRQMLQVDANKEDIIALLTDKNVPGDEITYNELADEILSSPPEQGYLTISNALQWRLQYKRVIELDNHIQGVVNYVWQ